MMLLSTVSTTFALLLGVIAAPSDNSSSTGFGGRSYGNNYLASSQQLSAYTTQAPRGFSKSNVGDDSTNYNAPAVADINHLGYTVAETNNINNGYDSTVTNNGYIGTGANYNNEYTRASIKYNNVYDSTGAINNGYYNNVYGATGNNNAYSGLGANNNGFTNYNNENIKSEAGISGMNDAQKYMNSNAGYTTSVSIQPSIQTQYEERFHPHTKFKGEEDSHTGEVVLPPGNVDSQDLVAAGSQFDLQDTFLQASETDPVSQPAPGATAGMSPPEIKPPQLPYGYDYNPPPPPPPSAPTPYYYYPPPAPPSNQYLPVPKPPPSNQYLPVPKPPPSNQYLPVAPPPPPPPPPPDQERQADYTYYYLGPKLWYIPLFFSIYFVLYVGALIIKAISKHKILFPQQLYNAASSVNQARGRSALDLITTNVFRALDSAAHKYLRASKARQH